MTKRDMTKHSPAALTRPARARTDSVVVHHLGIDIDRDGITTIDEAVRFFTTDPEGVATVTLALSPLERRAKISEWKRTGIPAAKQAAGFVPYHFLIDRHGEVARMLPLAARGAHASGYNDRSVAVCFLGNFDKWPPTDPELNAGASVVRDIFTVYGSLMVFGHDETLRAQGMPPKGCPGRGFPLDRLRALAREPQ